MRAVLPLPEKQERILRALINSTVELVHGTLAMANAGVLGRTSVVSPIATEAMSARLTPLRMCDTFLAAWAKQVQSPRFGDQSPRSSYHESKCVADRDLATVAPSGGGRTAG